MPLQLQRYFAQFSGPHRAAVESTGSWYWLVDLLGDLDVDLCLPHATRIKAISAAKVKPSAEPTTSLTSVSACQPQPVRQHPTWTPSASITFCARQHSLEGKD